MRKLLAFLVVMIICLLSVQVAWPMASSNYRIDWSTPAVGGGARSSPSYKVSDITGQLVIGASSSTSYQVIVGYQDGISSSCVTAMSNITPGGWHMVTLPGDLCGVCDVGGDGDLVCALDDDLDPCYIFHYDAETGGYVMAPPTENIPYHAGMGFWVRTYDEDVTIDAEVLVPTQGVVLPTEEGWSQIGNPFAFAIPANALRVCWEDTELPLLDAQAEGWVSAFLFGYDPVSAGYVMIDPATGCLEPWSGYWMKIYRDGCTLIIPPTACSSPMPAGTPISVKELEARGLEAPPAPPQIPVMGESPIDGLTVRNIPNPVRSEHTTTFKVEGKGVELVEAIRVDIYDLRGMRVFSEQIEDVELVWHTVNDAGELLANGVYLYQVWVCVGESWYPMEVQKLAVFR